MRDDAFPRDENSPSIGGPVPLPWNSPAVEKDGAVPTLPFGKTKRSGRRKKKCCYFFPVLFLSSLGLVVAFTGVVFFSGGDEGCAIDFTVFLAAAPVVAADAGAGSDGCVVGFGVPVFFSSLPGLTPFFVSVSGIFFSINNSFVQEAHTACRTADGGSGPAGEAIPPSGNGPLPIIHKINFKDIISYDFY